MNGKSLARALVPAAPGESTARASAEPPSANLLNALQSCLLVLPVPATQLQEVAQQVEQAVVGVCGNFQGMAARARKAASRIPLVKDVSGNGSTSDSDGINGLISSTRATMGGLLQRIERASTFSSLTVERMQAVEVHLGGLDRILHEIDQIAAQARLLAPERPDRSGATWTSRRRVRHCGYGNGENSQPCDELQQDHPQDHGSGFSGNRQHVEGAPRAADDTREAAMSRDEVNRAGRHDRVTRWRRNTRSSPGTQTAWPTAIKALKTTSNCSSRRYPCPRQCSS